MRLRGYVVWVPKRGGAEKDVPEAARLVPDKRTKQYWDEGGELMKRYTSVLSLPVDAWDIYMVYGPEARWEGDAPPAPDYWMHQLASPGVKGPRLDAEVFAAKARAALTPR